MKLTLRRVCSLFLLVCILASAMPVSAAEEKTVVDYVLVLDCSGTMLKNDPKDLAATACKIFIDHIPVQDARVSVITFGYGGGGFDYSSFKVEYDADLIHRILPMTGDMTLDQKLALHEEISAAARNKGSNTPVGQALAAAVDTLISSGSTDGNACVILLSDGGLTSPLAFQESIDLVDEAAIKAKEHEWPIYCIELDYRNSNESYTRDNRKRLDSICELSGAGSDGRTKVSEPDEVWAAFWKIFGKFNPSLVQEHEDLVIGPGGTVEKTFTISELSSEAQVIVYGTDVDAVELINKTDNSSVKFVSTQADKKYIVNVDPNYFSVKILCPNAGDWVAKVYGGANATVDTYIGCYSEMALSIVAAADGPEDALTKNDTVRVQSFFSYGGTDVTNDPFYTENKASLVVTSEHGFVEEYEMTGETNGYHCELPVGEISSGGFTVKVVLKHGMFRNGEQVSDALSFCSVNQPLKLKTDAVAIDRAGSVNEEFEAVDLTAIFDNPDGDPVEYELLCSSDRNVTFDYNVTDTGMMQISTGMVPGTYQMLIEARDPEMRDALVYNGLTLTVGNEGIRVLAQIKPQRIYTNYADNLIGKIFHGRYAENTILNLDLNTYYEDPDGVPLTYEPPVADPTDLISASIQKGVLHAEPLHEGSAVLKTTVSDGVETIEAVIPVEVIDVWEAYWSDHLLYWIVVPIPILVLICALIYMYFYIMKRSSVKGKWKVTISNGHASISADDIRPVPNITEVWKAGGKTFAMNDLISGCLQFMDDSHNLKAETESFLNMPEVQAIRARGIYNRIGFFITRIPRSDNVKIMYDNVYKPGARWICVQEEEFCLILKRETKSGRVESLTIRFEYRGK